MKKISNYYYKLLATGTLALMSTQASAIEAFDPTKDLSGGKKMTDVLDNANTSAQTFTTFLLNLMTLGGFIVIGISLFALWKASKEDGRERPLAAVIGLFMGGLMAGIGTIAWIIRNSLLG